MSDPYGGAGRDDRAEVVVVSGSGRQVAHRLWGLVLALGIVSIVFGIVVLANIWASVRLVAVFAGLFLVFAGLVQALGSSGSDRRLGRVLSGALAVVIGLGVIFWPEPSVKTLAVLVGLAFILWGVIMAVAALIDRSDGWGAGFGFGALLAIVGLIIVVWPGPTIAVLMVLVGLNALLFGVSCVVQALAMRRA
jgi:uncharacterized membrane protein HdeD (DUF308 family)